MTKRKTGRARRMAEMRETAEGLHRSGLMTSTDYERPRGTAARLLAIVRAKGVQAILG